MPHLDLETIAATQSELVASLERMWRTTDEISAKFADILKESALPLKDVVPKAGRGETLSD
jgi:uncharacterized protein YaaN involved in tellurite resistance